MKRQFTKFALALLAILPTVSAMAGESLILKFNNISNFPVAVFTSIVNEAGDEEFDSATRTDLQVGGQTSVEFPFYAAYLKVRITTRYKADDLVPNTGVIEDGTKAVADLLKEYAAFKNCLNSVNKSKIGKSAGDEGLLLRCGQYVKNLFTSSDANQNIVIRPGIGDLIQGGGIFVSGLSRVYFNSRAIHDIEKILPISEVATDISGAYFTIMNLDTYTRSGIKLDIKYY